MNRNSRHLLLAITILGTQLMACHHSINQEDITDAAYQYLTAMGNYHYKEAQEYATQETCETTLAYIIHNFTPANDTCPLARYIRSNTPAQIAIDSIAVESNNTAIAYYTKTTPIQVEHGYVDVVKEHGKWKAEVLIEWNEDGSAQIQFEEANNAAEKSNPSQG